MANEIFGKVAIGKLGFITFFYFIYYFAGRRISGFYYWTWTISLLVFYGFWGPVAASWYLMTERGDESMKEVFFYSSLISVAAPLIGYFIPLTTLILAYNKRTDTGLYISSKLQFWLGWFLGVLITILTIVFEFAFLPIIRVWWEIQQDPTLYLDEEEAVVIDESPDDIPDETVDENPDDIITTFFAT